MDLGELSGRIILGALALAVMFALGLAFSKWATGKDIDRGKLDNLNGIVNLMLFLGILVALYSVFVDS